MARRVVALLTVAFGALLASCGGGGGGPAGTLQQAALLLTAGTVPLAAAPIDALSGTVDLERLGIDSVARVYELTTPPNEPFSLNALARLDGNRGDVTLCIAHCSDGGLTPLGGPETLAEAGVLPVSNRAEASGAWLEVTGDGYARFEVRGAIERDQVFAVSASTDAGEEVALVRIAVGPESIVNRIGPDAPAADGFAGLLDAKTIYSSDADMFGLPVIASDGLFDNVVLYDENLADPDDWGTYEVRLRHDRLTGDVVGGGATLIDDWGFLDDTSWRDHEIASQGSLVALVRALDATVTLRISFDGGITYEQTEEFSAGEGDFGARLAQVAIGPDDRIGVAFWRSNEDYSCDLVLREYLVSARDDGDAPLHYSFHAERVVHRYGLDSAMPAILGMQYSGAGDLVIGHAVTRFILLDEATDEWGAITETFCATRLLGQPFREALLEVEDVTGFDPSVALVGALNTLRVFVAYEASDGIRMRVSEDAGASFSEAMVAGGPGAHMPHLFARPEGGRLRLDLFYLVQTDLGTELRLRHWDDYGVLPPSDHRLAKPVFERIDPLGVAEVVEDPETIPDEEERELVLRGPGWLGYDASLAGQDIVLVLHETVDAFSWYAPDGTSTERPLPFDVTSSSPVPPPDPRLFHQIRLLTID